MHFLYASDEGFSDVLKASLHSLLECHAQSDIIVHIVGQDLSAETVSDIEALVDEAAQRVEFIEMPDFGSLFGKELDTRRFTLSAFSRLFVDSLLSEDVDRVVYLDCDTVVTANLTSLWATDLDGAVVGAVNDCRNWRYLANLGLPRDAIYVNSGVLLIDVARFRSGGWQRRFCEAMVTFDGLLEFPDNDLICMLMQDCLKVLPPEYNMISAVRAGGYEEVLKLRRPTNYYGRAEFERAKTRPAILHYTTFFGVRGRPWNEGYDDEDGRPFRRHLEATRGIVRRPAQLSRVKSLAVTSLHGPLRPLALAVFGIAHSTIKPSLDWRTRRRIVELASGAEA